MCTEYEFVKVTNKPNTIIIIYSAVLVDSIKTQPCGIVKKIHIFYFKTEDK